VNRGFLHSTLNSQTTQTVCMGFSLQVSLLLNLSSVKMSHLSVCFLSSTEPVIQNIYTIFYTFLLYGAIDAGYVLQNFW
jgi:hypothetical protein